MDIIEAVKLHQIIRSPIRSIILDVLPKDKHKHEHIPMSFNIPVHDKMFIEKARAITAGKDDPIIVYDESSDSQASKEAVRKLEEAGFRRVYEFEGGLKEWKEHNFTTYHY